MGIPTDDRSPFDDAPSFEELSEFVAALELSNEQSLARVAELEELNRSLVERISDLEERLGRNPRNSSMPPSAEGFTKPPVPNRAERRAAKRRPGKQPGAEGKHLAQVDDPDQIEFHTPAVCAGCGESLEGAELVDSERRQVFELPPMQPFVTEHQMQRLRCTCGCETKAAPPREATAPACYGPGIRSLAVYLAVHQHLPYDRMAQLFNDVLGITISVGSLAQMVAEAGGALGLFQEVIRDLLIDAPAVHFDETGGRVAGKLHWVHVACTALYTLLDCHGRRGTVAMDEMGVLAKMRGVAVHDGWKPYRSYDVLHQLCNAHHLRELENVAVAWDQGWADEMIGLLVEAKETVDAARQTGAEHLDDKALHSIRVRYGTLVKKGWSANPEPAVGKRAGIDKKAFNLLTRLDTQRADVLRFATDFSVSWDNNQAERDVRLVKLQQKISGSWRTLDGARNFCHIRSYLSTMRKHGQPVLDGLRLLFDGGVWLPAGLPRT
ncbi:MAG: IS66 family transposase [Acidimicrobiales bacterium]